MARDFAVARADLARQVEDVVYGFLADYQFDPDIDRADLVEAIHTTLKFTFVIEPARGMILS